ncbi:catenin alpha-like [Glandiceps talaboti]
MDMPNNILTSLVQTRSIERVLAPIAAQVSQLIILNDSSQRNGELLPDLVPNAEAVMRATEDLIQVSQKLATETADEELKREIPKACESIGLAGKGMLLATQRLHMEGQSMEARNEMVKTARNVLQGTMKVLLVSDDAEVRKIIKASHWLLDRLTLLQSVQTMKALVTCFKGFTEALMLLSNLTDKRQKELTNPKQREYVLSAMTALKKSAPMLSTAMQTYVKFPNNPQSKTSKDYVVGQVITAVEDLISAVKMTENTATEGLEEPGMFTTRISKVCRHLSQDHRMMLNSDFEALMESIVRHSMAVASVSRERVRNQIVDTCKEILKQSNDITSQAKSLKENLNFHQLKEDFNKSCDVLISEFKSLEKHINQSLGYQVVDTLLETTEPFDRLVKAAVVPLQDKSVLREKLCIDMLQPLEEAFHDYSDKLIQFGGFIAASCADKRKVHYLRAVLNRLECLDPEVYPACLVARRDVLDRGALEHVKLLRREWHDEISTLVNIIDDMSDPYTFIELSESSMKSDVRECREAILISDSDMLATAANHLLGRGKRVVQVANKVVECHIDPIYRNGLQSYVNQLQKAIPLVKNAAYETVSLIDNSRLHDKLRERCEILLLCVSRVKEGLDEDTHPSILSPLRNNVRPKKKPMVTDYPDYPSPHDSMRSGDHNMYLSKPVPSIPDIAAAANPTNMSMYTSMNRPRSATHHPVTSPKSAIIALDVPVEFVNLITDLLKAIEKGDKIQIEMMCGVILTRTSNYKTMVDVIARLSEDSTKIRIAAIFLV